MLRVFQVIEEISNVFISLYKNSINTVKLVVLTPPKIYIIPKLSIIPLICCLGKTLLPMINTVEYRVLIGRFLSGIKVHGKSVLSNDFDKSK
ncbi:hypothetical protein Glove_51g95 [Diversispora epigaea]|uniref:Uncharacterized protein n=1 Tax=Diversispora epigaea TaxID=1348612 RepID=A0A397JPI1_9GLOM|nr:hypothetical protein Glove_51g95 [Diversispora epigaea]